MINNEFIVKPTDRILVTGAAGFVGSRVVKQLLERGYRHVRCLVRPSSDLNRLSPLLDGEADLPVPEIVTGNLLSRDDALRATEGATVILHLAAGMGLKSFSEAFLNSVVTTRNLMDAALQHGCLKRLVNISSIVVYSNRGSKRRKVLDETSPIEPAPQKRSDPYHFAKVKQEAMVESYGKRHGLPYVLVRLGLVYGPGGRHGIPGRVGLTSFGFFMHFGGSNRIPFTYVDNCAEAIVNAGLVPGVEGEAFNVSDDDPPSSREFLRAYKREVRSFRSVYFPKWASYLCCLLWEKSRSWLGGQLPSWYTKAEWHVFWRPTTYSNDKAKRRLGWRPRISTREGMRRHFECCREEARHA